MTFIITGKPKEMKFKKNNKKILAYVLALCEENWSSGKKMVLFKKKVCIFFQDNFLLIKIPRYLAYSFFSSYSWSIKISNLSWGLLAILNSSKLEIDPFKVSRLALSQFVTFCRAVLMSVSRFDKFDLSDRHIYHLQRGWNVTTFDEKK